MSKYYYYEQNNKIVGADTDQERLKRTMLIAGDKDETIKETNKEIVSFSGGYVFSDNEEYIKEYLKTLKMTKYDFFKYVCQPNGITYSQLMEAVNSNDEIAGAWNLCNHVYRCDEILNKYIKNYIPNITDDELNNIFTEHNIENV